MADVAEEKQINRNLQYQLQSTREALERIKQMVSPPHPEKLFELEALPTLGKMVDTKQLWPYSPISTTITNNNEHQLSDLYGCKETVQVEVSIVLAGNDMRFHSESGAL